jgi:ectoine hydroxylase-related dioxygenase (phytanoyl-CoA dioxygenase family)
MRLFSPQECRTILAGLHQRQHAPQDWFKGRAVTSSDYHALATDERILDLVQLLLGEDVLLWGATLARRTPGQTHAWHTDIESSSPTAECVTVWIGLAGTNAGSSLKVVSRSHIGSG